MDPFAQVRLPWSLRLSQGLSARTRTKWFEAGCEAADQTVHVVMTAYNSMHTLECAARTILDQSHKALRLTIFDDGSSDRTKPIIRELMVRDSRVDAVIAETNRGTYAAKNWVMAQSDADWLTFQDSDDWAYPDRIRLQLGAMITEGLAASCTRWIRCDPKSRTPLEVDGRWARMAANSLMIRRADVLASVGYFDPVRRAADTEYIERMRALHGAGTFRSLPILGIVGPLRPGSLTTAEGSGMTWTRTGQWVKRSVSGARARYLAAARAWHVRGPARLGRDTAAPFAPDIAREGGHSASDVTVLKGFGRE